MAVRGAFRAPSLLALLLLLVVSPARCLGQSGPIKTVVVVVMENRSFDHMLGWMKRLNPEIDGVTGGEWNPTNTTDPAAPRVYFGEGAQYVDPDPGHSYQEIRQQIFGSDDASGPPKMDGFVQQARSLGGNMTDAVMHGFAPDSVAVYRELVSQFAVCDRWFASVPSSTQPNRLFVHSGTSGGATSNNPQLLAKGYPQRTIFDNIHDAGLSFGVYFQDVPAVLFYRNLRKLKYLTKFHAFHPTFRDHARKGSLPNYVVIEQHYLDSKLDPANDDHPSHDVYQGQMFVKEIYETLRASPQWNQTLMVLTYDEHGGFFDHVPTPVQGVPSPDGIVGPPPYNFTFDRLGVRVPAILISPWIEKGTVVHGPNGPTPTSHYEHSSIPATVKKLFNLPQDFLTKRDAWAGTFESVVQTSDASIGHRRRGVACGVSALCHKLQGLVIVVAVRGRVKQRKAVCARSPLWAARAGLEVLGSPPRKPPFFASPLPPHSSCLRCTFPSSPPIMSCACPVACHLRPKLLSPWRRPGPRSLACIPSAPLHPLGTSACGFLLCTKYAGFSPRRAPSRSVHSPLTIRSWFHHQTNCDILCEKGFS